MQNRAARRVPHSAVLSNGNYRQKILCPETGKSAGGKFD
jgi:hypothetical protein